MRTRPEPTRVKSLTLGHGNSDILVVFQKMLNNTDTINFCGSTTNFSVGATSFSPKAFVRQTFFRRYVWLTRHLMRSDFLCCSCRPKVCRANVFRLEDVLSFDEMKIWCHDTMHNDTQHNDTQIKVIIFYTQHKLYSE